MSHPQEPDNSWIGLMLVAALIIAIALELSGVVRAPTNKSELCSCIIVPIDSVPKPITEEA